MISLIGLKIKTLRKEKRVKQEKLCCDILNRSILSKIENNKMLPSLPQLEHISQILDVPLNYFFQNSASYEALGHYNLINKNYSLLEELYNKKNYIKIIELENSIINTEINKDYFIGMAYFNMQLYNDAVINLKKYINTFNKFSEEQKITNAQNYAFALNSLCYVMIKNSNNNKALDYLFKAYQILIDYGLIDKKIYYIVINNIGSIYCLIREYKKAITFLEEFLAHVDDLSYLSLFATIHLSLNIAYYKTNNYSKAIDHIKLAITFFEYTRNYFDAGECYLNYLNCLRFTMHFEDALHLVSYLKSKYTADRTLINLFSIQEIIILFNLGDYQNCSEKLKIIKLNELRKKSRMDYYLIVGHIKSLQKNYSAAFNYLNRCKKYLLEKMYYLDLSILCKDLYLTSENEGYLKESSYYYKLYTIYKIQNIFIEQI